jgi:hypothetical protein
MSGPPALGLILAASIAAAGCAGAPAASVAPAPPATQEAGSIAPSGPGIGEVRYTCDTPPGFPLSVFDRPGLAELEAHPSAEALRTALGTELAHDVFPRSGYWLVGRGPARADYVARSLGAEAPFVFASFEVHEGVWALWGYGECRPVIVLDGLSLATWTFDPARPVPVGIATSFTALVTERACTGATPIAGRLQPPSITYGAETVAVVFGARPLVGDAFDCPGNPSTRVVVELREPLGDRRLVDGAFFPPADPSAGS